MRVLILGESGMLGNAVLKLFTGNGLHETWGTVRSDASRYLFSAELQSRLISGVDVLNQDALLDVFAQTRPEVVINCVGLIKQLHNANDPLAVLPVNALLPHQLAKLCLLTGARLIHVSTDCVFVGDKGLYKETDYSDARDLYGKSKYMGELHDHAHAITLRTSIIGHELNSNYALLDWFLSQEGQVKGYTKAIFSGMPTVELARVMHDWVLPQHALSGLYHVSAEPIAKYDLLKLVAEVYDKSIVIQPDDGMVIDRSLDSTLFQKVSGYEPPNWPELIRSMQQAR
ncbi:dTDP-4-dehydrorhamnose reductase family protein [Sedimenticola selenatireducens]|uniref:dTDP-4-dehydrorhamnose reductase n=1 Tax=Sedimenticola selenatireducens TaxID=191960 RepID=A0A2N6CVU8_9GAMM|nr:SDR family oxidoreductase [Sedimenticola selenatireducens]PLX61337.1 MAG: NAD(P)-dependent oxidoreductase [Sedimenticola selenatireducens]